MECVEGALKSSFRPETTLKRTHQQVFLDNLWAANVQNGVSGEDFWKQKQQKKKISSPVLSLFPLASNERNKWTNFTLQDAMSPSHTIWGPFPAPSSAFQ